MLIIISKEETFVVYNELKILLKWDIKILALSRCVNE